MAKEKEYTVRLNRETFVVPTKNGQQISGIIYRRGGHKFEANTIIRIKASALKDFYIQPPKSFENKTGEPFQDPHLLIEEIDSFGGA